MVSVGFLRFPFHSPIMLISKKCMPGTPSPARLLVLVGFFGRGSDQGPRSTSEWMEGVPSLQGHAGAKDQPGTVGQAASFRTGRVAISWRAFTNHPLAR